MLESFPRDVAGLAGAGPVEIVELGDGDRFELRIGPVAKRLGDSTVRMLGYNGSVPGPTLRVRQGSEVLVDIENLGDTETTVHWHGLRLDNRYDGTHGTQRPIPVGGRFRAVLSFPDPGGYWYHPHIRQDHGQELGLYGGIVVAPADPGYWPPVHREISLCVDDVLLLDGDVAPISRSGPDHVAMGRYGNVFLVNGEINPVLTAGRGEVVRFYLTNTANARVFNLSVPGATMKLVGGDSGHVEQEQIVGGVILAPSERAVVDVLFDRPGRWPLRHSTPGRVRELATIEVGDRRSDPQVTSAFHLLRRNTDLALARERITGSLGDEPDHTLSFLAELDAEMGHHHHHHHHGHGAHDGDDGIEWEDTMAEFNRTTTPANTRWKIVDVDTGAVNHDIAWRFRVGDQVKIRLRNELAGDHPMHHPFHVHGAGRFLVLSRDGVIEPNLVWKDTVLVRSGEVVDILLDVTNAGHWMAHCHIAEHHEAGMMFSFDVEG
ncbi:multicopper oxidase family protein [Virgisporangium aurantiacum]|uniref:multicopper oxidase family protein n=1 Tax=Virgisporangium aurantiacum TaxID=175570 RepID=UPI0019512D66|nr:multicopper oxidase family protein [Virgisporangium aurantiacum]